MAEVATQPETLSSSRWNSLHIGLTQPRRRFDQCIEDSLQVEGRAADDLEHIGGGGLLLERLAQLVEQPRVLDGDDGLRREVVDQLDLLFGKRANLLPVDGNGTDQTTVLEHWDQEVGPSTCSLHKGNKARVAFYIARLGHEIGDVDNAFGRGEAGKRITRIFADGKKWIFGPTLGVGGRRVALGGKTKRIVRIEKQVGELCLAYARRILQYGLKHRLQLAG